MEAQRVLDRVRFASANMEEKISQPLLNVLRGGLLTF